MLDLYLVSFLCTNLLCSAGKVRGLGVRARRRASSVDGLDPLCPLTCATRPAHSRRLCSPASIASIEESRERLFGESPAASPDLRERLCGELPAPSPSLSSLNTSGESPLASFPRSGRSFGSGEWETSNCVGEVTDEELGDKFARRGSPTLEEAASMTSASRAYSPTRDVLAGASEQLRMLVTAVVHDASKWHDDKKLVSWREVSRSPSLLPSLPDLDRSIHTRSSDSAGSPIAAYVGLTLESPVLPARGNPFLQEAGCGRPEAPAYRREGRASAAADRFFDEHSGRGDREFHSFGGTSEAVGMHCGARPGSKMVSCLPCCLYPGGGARALD
jgi:hypothetical protein